MVSKWWMHPIDGESRDQLKIYTESNQSDFLRIFGDLSSMQTFGIYRGLLARD